MMKTCVDWSELANIEAQIDKLTMSYYGIGVQSEFLNKLLLCTDFCLTFPFIYYSSYKAVKRILKLIMMAYE